MGTAFIKKHAYRDLRDDYARFIRMTKLVDQAIAKIRELSEPDQARPSGSHHHL
jgi:hypothetical protein